MDHPRTQTCKHWSPRSIYQMRVRMHMQNLLHSMRRCAAGWSEFTKHRRFTWSLLYGKRLDSLWRVPRLCHSEPRQVLVHRAHVRTRSIGFEKRRSGTTETCRSVFIWQGSSSYSANLRISISPAPIRGRNQAYLPNAYGLCLLSFEGT